jgi:hypothetical protein
MTSPHSRQLRIVNRLCLFKIAQCGNRSISRGLWEVINIKQTVRTRVCIVGSFFETQARVSYVHQPNLGDFPGGMHVVRKFPPPKSHLEAVRSGLHTWTGWRSIWNCRNSPWKPQKRNRIRRIFNH